MFGLIFACIFLAYHLDMHHIIKNTYTDFKRYSGSIPLYLNVGVSFYLFYTKIKLQILQILNGTITKIGNHKYILKYSIEGKMYTTLLNLKRGPSDILQILDKNSNDVTANINPYMGPDETFRHSEVLTPVKLGYEELTVNLSNGKSVKIVGDTFLGSFTEEL